MTSKDYTGDCRLPKSEIIKKQDDFSMLFRKGCHWKGYALHFYYTPSDRRRVGFAVPKKLGNAVIRNRYKRLLREIYRHRRCLMVSCELIILIKEKARNMDYHDLSREVDRFLSECGLLEINE